MPRIPQSQSGALSGLMDVVNPVAGIIPIGKVDRPLASLLENFASRLPKQIQDALIPMYAQMLPKRSIQHSGFLWDRPATPVSIRAPIEYPFVPAHELGHAVHLLSPGVQQVGRKLRSLIDAAPQRLRDPLFDAFGGLQGSKGTSSEILADALGSILTGQHRGNFFQDFAELKFPSTELLRGQFARRMATSPSGQKFTNLVRRKAGLLDLGE